MNFTLSLFIKRALFCVMLWQFQYLPAQIYVAEGTFISTNQVTVVDENSSQQIGKTTEHKESIQLESIVKPTQIYISGNASIIGDLATSQEVEIVYVETKKKVKQVQKKATEEQIIAKKTKSITEKPKQALVFKSIPSPHQFLLGEKTGSVAILVVSSFQSIVNKEFSIILSKEISPRILPIRQSPLHIRSAYLSGPHFTRPPTLG